MKFLLRTAILLLAAFLFAGVAQGQRAPRSPRPPAGGRKALYALGGRVVNAEDQEEVRDALVHLEGNQLGLQEVTDQRGQFGFFGIRPGSYTLVVTADGYEVARVPVVVVGMNTTSTVIRLNQLKEDASAPPGPTVAARQQKIPGKTRKA